MTHAAHPCEHYQQTQALQDGRGTGIGPADGLQIGDLTDEHTACRERKVFGVGAHVFCRAGQFVRAHDAADREEQQPGEEFAHAGQP